LEEKHRLPPFRRRRDDDVREVRRDGAREVAPLTVLAVVDVARVIGADPLGPSLQDEAPLGALLARGELRIADEQVVNEVAPIDQCVGQIDHARGETADERIAVGTLERDEHHVVHGRARIMARARMTALQRIREDPQKVRDMLAARGFDAPPLDRILALDRKARDLRGQVEAQSAERNKASRGGPPSEDVKARMREVGERIKALQGELMAWMIDLKLPHGFTEIYPPFLTTRETLIASSHLPHFAANQYHDETDDLWLIPTAEPQLVSLHRDEVLDGRRFPLRYVSYTACFRREQMSAGRDVRGIKRGHQFDKVEMVVYCHPEDSPKELEALVARAVDVLERLEIPVRVLELCTGDLAFQAMRGFDVEAWAPGVGEWLEVSSCSNCGSFQADRGN